MQKVFADQCKIHSFVGALTATGSLEHPLAENFFLEVPSDITCIKEIHCNIHLLCGLRRMNNNQGVVALLYHDFNTCSPSIWCCYAQILMQMWNLMHVMSSEELFLEPFGTCECVQYVGIWMNSTLRVLIVLLAEILNIFYTLNCWRRY